MGNVCKSLVRWLLAFFLILQGQFHLSDRLLNIIFFFLKTFFVVLGRFYPPCAIIGTELPTSFYMARKTYVRAQKTSFKKFSVCKRCGTVWKYSDCLEYHGTIERAKLCTYEPPLGRRRARTRCNGLLLKTVELIH